VWRPRPGSVPVPPGTQLAVTVALTVSLAAPTIYVPDDEICFHLFDAASADAVRQAGDRANLDAQRIVHAIQGTATEP
jgi:hypothetical protein